MPRWTPRRRPGARRADRAPRGSCRASRRRRDRSGCCGSSAPGPCASICVRTASGQRDQLEPRRGARVGREHAPAARGGEHDHAPAARQRLRRERRRPLEGLLDASARAARRAGGRRRRRRGRRWRASRCGWRAARLPSAATPPFTSTSGLRAVSRRDRAPRSGARRRRPRDSASDDRRLGIGARSTRGSRRAPSAPSCPTEIAFAMPTPVCDRVVEERRDEVAALARDRDAARRRIRRDDLRAHRDAASRSRPARSARPSAMPSSSATATSSRSQRAAFGPGLAVARRSRRRPRARRASRRRAAAPRWRRSACRRRRDRRDRPGPRATSR